MALLVVARCDHYCWLSFFHPLAGDLRVEMDIDFVLKHRGLVRAKSVQHSANRSKLYGLFRIAWADDRAWPSPDQSMRVQRPSNRFCANSDAMGIPQRQRQQPARPTPAVKANLARGMIVKPAEDDHHPPSNRDRAALLLFQHALVAFRLQCLAYALNRRGTAKRHVHDLAPTPSPGQQQQHGATSGHPSVTRPSIKLHNHLALGVRQSDNRGPGLFLEWSPRNPNLRSSHTLFLHQFSHALRSWRGVI